jgi:hypothetical protein
MLRIASNEEYNNLKGYLQCIAFAQNCTYSSVIECAPFEAGHGLRARTVAEANEDGYPEAPTLRGGSRR